MTKTRLTLTAVALCGLLLPFAGCDSAENPIAPGGSVLFITANPTEIGLSGSSTITVTGFKPDNNPLNPGTLVTLSTSIGILDETVLRTDSEGKVSTTLRGNGVAGTATVQAQVSGGGGTGGGGGDGEGGGTGGSSGATASTSVQIGEPMESQPTVVISANPTTVATGEASEISLLGRSSDGSPVEAGQRIRLTANFGRIVEQGGTGSSPTVNEVFTDSNGEAFANFIAGDRGGMGEVTAILGTSEPAMVMITIRAALNSLDLSVNPSEIDRLENGEMIQVRVVLLDAQGEPVSDTLVRLDSQFALAGGTVGCAGSINALSIGTFDDDSPLSDNDGIADATLTVRDVDVDDIPEDGTFIVSARAISEGVEICREAAVRVRGAPQP